MAHIQSDIPLIGFAAYSGTGKTTLLTALIPLLTQRGLRVGMIKHAHHNFDIDHPGKDSYRVRKAGAQQMLIASRRRWALMVENDPAKAEPTLQQLVTQLDSAVLDCILVEGFKHEAFPKIELHRSALNHDLIYPHDNNIIAVATDQDLDTQRPIAQLDINAPQQIAAYIVDFIIEQNHSITKRKP